MKILLLTNHVRKIGNGIVNVAVDLACGLAESGHEVHFGSEGGEFEELLAASGVHHHLLPVPGPSASGLGSILRFHRLVSDIKPEIVHSHMVKWAAIAKAVGIVHRYSTVATVHNVYQKSSKVMGWSDGVVALGRSSAVVVAGWGVRAAKIHEVVNAPLESPRLTKAESVPPFPMEGPSIVSVGGLYFRKGFHHLIEGFAAVKRELPSATLHIVGEGPDRAHFEELAARVSPQGVVFHGYQADPRPFLKGGDVVVLASLRESFPLVLLEAREFGAKIVATDVDGNREALDDGRAGWLVPPADPQALANAIIEVIGSPAMPGVRDHLERFRVPSHVKSYEEIYRKVRRG